MRTMLCALFVLCLLCGYKSQDHHAAQNMPTQGKGDSSTAPTKTERTPEQEKLLSVLYNEVPLVDETGKTVYVKDYHIANVIQPIYAVPESYAFLDFDNDGSVEMFANVSSDHGFFLVMHMDDEQVYGYLFSQRSMMEPKLTELLREAAVQQKVLFLH